MPVRYSIRPKHPAEHLFCGYLTLSDPISPHRVSFVGADSGSHRVREFVRHIASCRLPHNVLAMGTAVQLAATPLQRFQKFYQVEFLLFSQAEIKVGVVMVHHIA